MQAARATPEPSDEPPADGTAPARRRHAKRRARTALGRNLSDFLVEFSIVLHNRSMYPDDHPQLQNAADRFMHRLETLLEARDSISLGVAHHQLLVDGVATDPENALLRDLARRLHRHQLTSVRFDRGATLGEIDDLLGALCSDPTRVPGPLGHRLDRISHWDHLRLTAVDYGRLAFREESLVDPEEPPRAADDLWLALARLTGGDEATGDAAADSPVVARAIEAHAGEIAYDRVVLDYLTRIAEEMSGRLSPAEDRLRNRVSALIKNLDPQRLRQLLEVGANPQATRQFALNAAQTLAVDAVVEVLEAAADVSQQTISHHLLRLLRKLARQASSGSEQVRTEADGALRKHVARLLAGWTLEDPNPTGYTSLLDSMATDQPWDLRPDSSSLETDPESVLQLGLEVGVPGPRVRAAVALLLARGRLETVVTLLNDAPVPGAADALWAMVATPECLRAELTSPRRNRALIEQLARKLRTGAVEQLFAQLVDADRPTRAWLLQVLRGFGPVAAEAAVAHLTDARWYVRRNSLGLLQQIGEWPSRFSPVPLFQDPEPQVRRAAIKLALGSAELRPQALRAALSDASPRVLTLGLVAAAIACPPELHPRLDAIVADTTVDPELRALAVRALGASGTPTARQRLIEVVLPGRRWLPRRLAAPSPPVLAALAVLASAWADDPAAQLALGKALRHADPAVRAAATRAA
jgi:DNA-binding transcriptional ArsR family regulator